MAKLIVVAQFKVSPEDREQVLEAARIEAEAVSRLEPECERFDVSTSISDPSRGVFYEVFKDEDAFESHKQMPHFSDSFDAIDGFGVEWDAMRYKPTDI